MSNFSFEDNEKDYEVDIDLDSAEGSKITRLKAQYQLLKSEKKTERVEIRLSKTEAEKLKFLTDELGYTSLTDCIKTELIYKDYKDLFPREVIVVHKQDPDLIYYLNKIGHNLNLSVKAALTSAKSGHQIDVENLEKSIDEALERVERWMQIKQ
ncbi:TPA: hypothetical protein ACF35N_004490 [Vibrio parahaemolyticus]